MLSANDILTSSGKYPERAKLAGASITMNAAQLAAKVDRVLAAIGYTGPKTVSSGLRTPSTNAAAGGAKRSLHLTGQAVDFETQAIGLAIRAHPKGAEALRKEGLFMEALESTKGKGSGWTHLQDGGLKDRPNREFLP